MTRDEAVILLRGLETATLRTVRSTRETYGAADRERDRIREQIIRELTRGG